MYILAFTNSPLDPRSGSGKTVLNYTGGLRSLGHTVEVSEPKDYEWWRSLRRASKVRLAGGAWSLIHAKLKAQPVDLMEFYGDEFGPSIWQLSQRPRRPFLVAHTNGLEMLATARERSYTPAPLAPLGRLYHDLVEKSHDWFSTLAFASADAFVALCELDRKHVLNLGYYPEEWTAVVEPGLDPEYLAVPWRGEREERIVFTGSWIARKGVDTLIPVMTGLLSERPQLQFSIYGAGTPPAVVLSAFPAELHPRIQVFPRLPEKDLADGLARAQVFFFPTQYEGFGIALAEAMACGCAAVTTRTGFGAELRDGEEALLCDFEDAPAMTSALTRLLDDYTLRQRIAQGGWQRTRSLTWEANIRKLEALYRQWVVTPQRRCGVEPR
ncbi:glycosyltransferase family 4 protein [Anthocerotibacter panamensis]|uniref:glycosyltransferase family 4 protein n=1 Tax=Anthocerotibacter panamensis TaxID=2857077 RepID=UPI001C404B6D|nr:glycosyltransferase family 4 protein [Anthocerotibacter panamensis]